MKRALITGISGQDGAYLSKLLLEKGYEVFGVTRSFKSLNTDALEYLGVKDAVQIEECDLTDLMCVNGIFRQFQPDEIYNLASQSSVGLSFAKPVETLNYNIVSVINILETIRTISPATKFYQASSSEMFGNVEQLPIREDSIINPASPYAISKAAAHWAVKNYRESYGLFACCGILFNHESYLRGPNFFVKKVIREAIKIKNEEQDVLKVGNLNIKRDFGYAPDYVVAMWKMLQQDIPGEYIICSGESIYLKQIVEYVFNYLGIDKSKIIVDEKLLRPNEIQDIYGDNTKAMEKLNWDYDKNFFEVLNILIEEEKSNLTQKRDLLFG
jgi:GDPmannose 4,6-dehydratase